MAFVSMHNEEAFKKKTLEYILNGTTELEVVTKKWMRVPDKHRDWIWGNVESELEKQGELSQEQKDRLAEVKAAIGK